MSTWPDGYNRRILAEVDSTLDEARRATDTLTGSEWILAHTQTKARGRRGRAWLMPKGNFAATLVLRPQEPVNVAVLRSFVAALALFDAISDVTGRTQGLTLKWPNDVLLNGGKLAGILLEGVGKSGQMDHLAIGIGVNLAAAPNTADVEDGALPPVSLAGETGISVDPETFLTHLAAAFARYETQFQTYGFAPIRTAWLARAAKLGQVIRARTGTAEVIGTFKDVDKDGQLVLETAEGRVTLPAADVYF